MKNIRTHLLAMLALVSASTSALAQLGPPEEKCTGLGTIPLIEYYHPTLNHYFYTTPCSPGEIAFVDSGGAGKEWRRTGWVFAVYAIASAAVVSRFYGSVSPGPNSHFYSIDAAEIAQLKQLEQTTPASQPRWNSELSAFFGTIKPTADGRCNSDAPVQPLLKRFYNRGFEFGKDPNHRFVASTAANVIAEMKTKGWVDEGNVMCIGGAWLN
jgi:hypothetical protein